MQKVACRTPAEGREGVTNIPAWKFDLIRGHILDALEPGDLTLSALPQAVRERLNDDELERLGSVGWHVTTVKLELEVRGEIERIRAAGPQRIRRVRPC